MTNTYEPDTCDGVASGNGCIIAYEADKAGNWIFTHQRRCAAHPPGVNARAVIHENRVKNALVEAVKQANPGKAVVASFDGNRSLKLAIEGKTPQEADAVVIAGIGAADEAAATLAIAPEIVTDKNV